MLMQLDLNERENEIITLLADGLTNKEIAARTGLTLYTVKWYLKQIYSKLDVNNRTQAVTRAQELGLLSAIDDPAPRTPSNLPTSLTHFFGRETELERIQTLLTDVHTRLVTVHGMGGMGKTRLALEAAQRLRPHFADGVYWVSLADVDSDHDPLLYVLNALNLTTGRSLNVINTLSKHLKQRHCLILFDNFENHLPFVGQLVALLQATDHVRMLLTSREVLNVSAETVLPLTGMMLPIEHTEQAIVDNAAYQLYVERTRAIRADYNPDPDEQAEIARICRLVQGMPLALELAAGWGHMLTAAEIRTRIEKNADILRTNQPDKPARQQSVRATFDYSWQMLEPRTQQTLLALSIFRESFTLKAAETVAEASLPELKHLLDCALLQRAGDQRFTMHALIRQYTSEMLAADADYYETINYRHGQYFLNFVMQSIEALYRPYDSQLLREFDREKQNLNKAWTYALAEERYNWIEAAAEVGYTCDLAFLWHETDGLFAYTLGKIPADHTLLRGRLLAFRAIFAYRRGDTDAMQRYAHAAWPLLIDGPYKQDAIAAQVYVMVSEAISGNLDEARTLFKRIQEALDDEHLVLNRYMKVLTRSLPGVMHFAAGEYEQAIPHFEQTASEVWQVLQLRLAECYIALDRRDDARDLLETLYEDGLSAGDYMVTVGASYFLHKLDTPADQLFEALLQDYSELARMSENYQHIAAIIMHLGNYFLIRGRRDHAGDVYYAATRLLAQISSTDELYALIIDIAERIAPTDANSAAHLYNYISAQEDTPLALRQVTIEQYEALPAVTLTDKPQDLLPLLEAVLLNSS